MESTQQSPSANETSPSQPEKLTMKKLAERLEMVEARNALLEDMIEAAELERQQRINAGEDAEIGVELLDDPFDVQNPLAIKQVEIRPGVFENVTIPRDEDFPAGQVLGWKSERYRDSRGWRGWVEILIGDKYAGQNGELLANYLPDPPRGMEGEAKVDRKIRRAGMVLARLDKRIWEARNQRREVKSDLQRGKVNMDSPKFVRAGVELVGEGMRDQARPRSGFKMGEKPDMGYAVRDGLTHRGSVPLHTEQDE